MMLDVFHCNGIVGMYFRSFAYMGESVAAVGGEDVVA